MILLVQSSSSYFYSCFTSVLHFSTFYTYPKLSYLVVLRHQFRHISSLKFFSVCSICNFSVCFSSFYISLPVALFAHLLRLLQNLNLLLYTISLSTVSIFLLSFLVSTRSWGKNPFIISSKLLLGVFCKHSFLPFSFISFSSIRTITPRKNDSYRFSYLLTYLPSTCSVNSVEALCTHLFLVPCISLLSLAVTSYHTIKFTRPSTTQRMKEYTEHTARTQLSICYMIRPLLIIAIIKPSESQKDDSAFLLLPFVPLVRATWRRWRKNMEHSWNDADRGRQRTRVVPKVMSNNFL